MTVARKQAKGSGESAHLSDTAIPRLAGMAQPHKGDRDLMVTRPPRETANLVRERASAAGVSISEYIAAALTRDVSNPVPAVAPKSQELPMTG